MYFNFYGILVVLSLSIRLILKMAITFCKQTLVRVKRNLTSEIGETQELSWMPGMGTAALMVSFPHQCL